MPLGWSTGVKTLMVPSKVQCEYFSGGCISDSSIVNYCCYLSNSLPTFWHEVFPFQFEGLELSLKGDDVMKDSTDPSFFEVKRYVEIVISTIEGSISGKCCLYLKKKQTPASQNKLRKTFTGLTELLSYSWVTENYIEAIKLREVFVTTVLKMIDTGPNCSCSRGESD